MTGTEVALNILYETFKFLNKSKSEKFEEEWKKDVPKLMEAIMGGDVEYIASITVKYSNFLQD